VNEVSCKVFAILFKPLKAKGVSLESLVVGTDVPAARLRSKKDRIDWIDYCTIMRNARPHFTDEEYVELGRAWMRSPGLKFAFVIARLLFSAMDFYRWMNKPRDGVGNQMFTCITPTHREPSENVIEMELTLPEGFEVCWDFFLISRGNMEELPKLLGLQRSQVELTRIDRGARYRVVVPQGIPFITRVKRFFTWPFTVRSAARELKEAHETLLDRYEELETARTMLNLQAAQLRTAHTLNELVQRDLDLERTLATIATALVEEARFTWAEIRLIDGDRRFAFGAEMHEQGLHQPLHSRGGERLGDICAASSVGADRSEREQLLNFVSPTLSLALENAIYRTGLERLVDVRTAELSQARDQLECTVVQLRDAQGARERFFGNISHEIRTPLSIILLAASDIERRAGALLDERAKEGLGSVSDSARKLVRLVDELLLLAAGQENKLTTRPEPTDLAALLRSLFAAWRPSAEAAGLELLATVPDALVAYVDPVALERVMSNLISNAVKYTPRGGKIQLQLATDAESIRISVLDDGKGISTDLASRLFGRFERADGEDRTISGTGLGLALAKQLVEIHGGTIAHHPREAGGTEMRVLLPVALLRGDAKVAAPTLRLVDAARPPPTATVTRATPEGLSKGTIVLAEDDVRLADMVAQLLSDEYTVHVGHDGAEALELVKQHQPQLLITDVDMPTMDGIELARRFREVTNERLAPIIILSAMIDLRTRLAGLDAGAVDYVTKPFDPNELRARVRAQFRMRDLAVRLSRAEQLSSLGVLTSSLAHELRNPANGVVNAVAPLIMLLPPELKAPDHPVAQLLDVISNCSQQIGVLSKQLLGFRHTDTKLDVRQTDARKLVQRALTLCETAVIGVEVRLAIEDGVGLLCAPPLMMQVLTNLIENGAHAAGRGGWVSVAAHVTGSRILIEVTDSGTGVPLDVRDKIFEPFFTTKPQGVGTGLGLSLARDIVTRHGGTISIGDRGGRHVFVIDLPHHSGLDATASAV